MKRLYKTIVLALVGAALVLSGCDTVSGRTPERKNAHQSLDVDRTPPEVLAMPDHWSNIATKCDGHGHRVYATSNKDSAPSYMVVITDPSCPGLAEH